MKHADQLARVFGDEGDVTRLVTLRKGLARSIAVKLPDALDLIMRCDKLVERLARKRRHSGDLRRVHLPINYRIHDGRNCLSFTRDAQ